MRFYIHVRDKNVRAVLVNLFLRWRELIACVATHQELKCSEFLGSVLQKPSQLCLTMIRIPKCCGAFFFEYETPKVVSIQNVPLGILRVVLQLLVIAFVVVFQLWYSQGYQGGKRQYNRRLCVMVSTEARFSTT